MKIRNSTLSLILDDKGRLGQMGEVDTFRVQFVIRKELKFAPCRTDLHLYCRFVVFRSSHGREATQVGDDDGERGTNLRFTDVGNTPGVLDSSLRPNISFTSANH